MTDKEIRFNVLSALYTAIYNADFDFENDTEALAVTVETVLLFGAIIEGTKCSVYNPELRAVIQNMDPQYLAHVCKHIVDGKDI